MNVVAMTCELSRFGMPISILEPVSPELLAAKPTGYGMPLLAPTPGRVGEGQTGRFSYRDEPYRIVPSRHGFLRNLEWRVEGRTDHALTATVRVSSASGAHGTFPFAFDAEYLIEVGSARLRATLSVTGRGDRVQPINAGWHPYFCRTGAARVGIPAARLWQLNGLSEPTPTGRLAPVEAATDFRQGRVLGEQEHWDDVFTGLNASAGRCRCWVDDLSVSPIVRRWGEFATEAHGEQQPLRNVQLYTPPGRQAISLEPLSCPPDAINLREKGITGTDVCDVEPGGRVRFCLDIGIEQLLDPRT